MANKVTVDPLANALLWTSTTDPETHTWALAHPWNPFIIVIAYLAVVLYILPTFMKNRQPYVLKNLIVVYNVAHVILSVYLVYKIMYPGIPFLDLFSPVCHHKVDVSREHSLAITTADWWYMLAKILELPDTLFFILRKKYNQVSFLHVYHHSTTFLIAWINFVTVADDNHLLPTCFNSFVHIIMYSYYAIAAMGPEYQKYVWWKKYITKLQLFQFFTLVFYLIWGYFMSNCSYRMITSRIMIADIVAMIYLFSKFYAKEYQSKSKQKQK